jgi:glycerol-1-phosphate dehydrogenase [NAD(P)+]
MVSTKLHQLDVAKLAAVLQPLGLPSRPEHLGITSDEVVDLILKAPNTRPGRFTILEEKDLDDAGTRALVRELWG